jgi:diacylglycerol diphosphate phosphatase/phosphatidate phosphatase
MGLFNKRNDAAAADTTTATGTHEKKQGIFARKNGTGRTWNSRPTFGQWIKATALDLVSMAVLGAIGLGVYFADPAPSRSFPGTFGLRDAAQRFPANTSTSHL